MKVRVGFGYDVHALVPERDLWLGGVKIEHTMGLQGHSDADVLIHAICDALLGAANMRDIGYHFPDTPSGAPPNCVQPVPRSPIRQETRSTPTARSCCSIQWNCFVMPDIHWVI